MLYKVLLFAQLELQNIYVYRVHYSYKGINEPIKTMEKTEIETRNLCNWSLSKLTNCVTRNLPCKFNNVEYVYSIKWTHYAVTCRTKMPLSTGNSFTLIAPKCKPKSLSTPGTLMFWVCLAYLRRTIQFVVWECYL